MICLFCGSPITTSNPKWQLFHRSYGCMGSFHQATQQCFYCNALKECKDHPWPVMSRPEEYTEGVTRRRRDGETLPSCRECNYILWKHSFQNIVERLLFIAKSYKKRAKTTGLSIHSNKMLFAMEKAEALRKFL